MCALLSLRPDFPWSHRCRRACPPPYHNSSLLRNFERRIRRVWRKMKGWADRNRGVALTQFPPFPVAPFMLTHFCFVNLQVHWACLVHWVTAGPKHNSAYRTVFPESLRVAHIPATPGKMTQTHDWLLSFVLMVDVYRITVSVAGTFWFLTKSCFLAIGFGTSTLPIQYFIYPLYQLWILT